jgi:hypothetical protein
MTAKQFAALAGFFFVAAWIAFSFGQAILCLLGAGAFYAIAAAARGEVDLVEVQDRLQAMRNGNTAPRVR